VTNTPLTNAELIPNIALRKAIADWRGALPTLCLLEYIRDLVFLGERAPDGGKWLLTRPV